jgi:hypothetical protein
LFCSEQAELQIPTSKSGIANSAKQSCKGATFAEPAGGIANSDKQENCKFRPALIF